ncbi:hypothetical protein HPP92_004213 [Vanilla planifolia]|uniref:ZF-HD dimerization-type domain-containing protein n=1 Tax=Vanilla planifolia TaxID=51239 RepID=A0A835RKN8_VANPL|nr:hypothetical protein HPP92_004213 [Vanilla planifolia]
MDLPGNEGDIPIQLTNSYVESSRNFIQLDSFFPYSSLPAAPINMKKAALVRYKECLKNHAASIGGNAVDGCGEFMPNGEEGTIEAFKCSACHCHRNFHRKEVEGESSSCEGFSVSVGQKGLLLQGTDPFGYNVGWSSRIQRHSFMRRTESEDMQGFDGSTERPPMGKKRFRTRFTSEQKEKMLCFAEKIGWKLPRQEESVVQQLCQEIGVKRRVLRVWMHNNKQSFAKKTSSLQLE